MRTAIGAALVGLLVATLSGVCFGQAWSSPAPRSAAHDWPDWTLRSRPSPPEPPTRMWVHLNGAADLERLRATNFIHYLRAQPILAAANEICQPVGLAHAYPTRFEGNYLSCGGPFLMTNPPKALLKFHLDNVGYIALVSVRVKGGEFEFVGSSPTK